jgi:hypothetical protein
MRSGCAPLVLERCLSTTCDVWRFTNSLLRHNAKRSQSLTVALAYQNSPNVTSFVNFRTPLRTVDLEISETRNAEVLRDARASRDGRGKIDEFRVCESGQNVLRNRVGIELPVGFLVAQVQTVFSPHCLELGRSRFPVELARVHKLIRCSRVRFTLASSRELGSISAIARRNISTGAARGSRAHGSNARPRHQRTGWR